MSELDDLPWSAAECPKDVTLPEGHNWQPISMVFETQLLDDQGRVLARQPHLETGRVYLVCLDCAQHTYMSTSWARFRLYGSEDRPAFNRIAAPHRENP